MLSVCCLSETVAVALIGAERAELQAGPLRTLLTRLWADEIGHARFGWHFLAEAIPTLRADAIARTNAYLARAFAHLEAHERAHLPLVRLETDAAAYGLCDGYESRALFYETVSSVILPQLARLGLEADRAWTYSLRARHCERIAAVKS